VELWRKPRLSDQAPRGDRGRGLSPAATGSRFFIRCSRSSPFLCHPTPGAAPGGNGPLGPGEPHPACAASRAGWWVARRPRPWVSTTPGRTGAPEGISRRAGPVRPNLPRGGRSTRLPRPVRVNPTPRGGRRPPTRNRLPPARRSTACAASGGWSAPSVRVPGWRHVASTRPSQESAAGSIPRDRQTDALCSFWRHNRSAKANWGFERAGAPYYLIRARMRAQTRPFSRRGHQPTPAKTYPVQKTGSIPPAFTRQSRKKWCKNWTGIPRLRTLDAWRSRGIIPGGRRIARKNLLFFSQTTDSTASGPWASALPTGSCRHPRPGPGAGDARGRRRSESDSPLSCPRPWPPAGKR
jgi:hypothetical protein